jgi:hypothetical protein
VNNGAGGGTGICSTITGQRVFYAGGGGGGAYLTGVGSFGVAGGGNGGDPYNTGATSGATNTGGGGGGTGTVGGSTGVARSGQAGGSGIVIIRYPATQLAPTSTTGSPQITNANGYQIYTWTSSGTITF